MAKVPLAGTDYIPGVTERETLSEIRRLLAKKHEEETVTHVGRPLEAAGE
jgi:hypothetical protein